MTIWLHIGLGKTGTKTIQRFLKKNRRPLRALGYLYPDPGAGGNAHYNLAYQLLHPRKLKPGRKTWEDMARLAAENPRKTILLSAETFGAFKAKDISAVQRFLPHADLRMIVYLREQSALLESWYSQRIKNGAASEDIEVFGDSVLDGMSFTRLLKPWRDILGRDKMSVRVFDRSRFVNNDLIDDFLSTIGLPVQRVHAGYVPISAHNVTPGPKALSLIDVVRGELSAHAASMGLGNEHVRRALTSVLQSSVRQWPKEERVRLLTPERRAEVERRFASDNALVLEEYLNGSHPTLFPTARDRDAPANLLDSGTIVASLPPLELVRAMTYALACSLRHEVKALRQYGILAPVVSPVARSARPKKIARAPEKPVPAIESPSPGSNDSRKDGEARRLALRDARREQRMTARKAT